MLVATTCADLQAHTSVLSSADFPTNQLVAELYEDLDQLYQFHYCRVERYQKMLQLQLAGSKLIEINDCPT